MKIIVLWFFLWFFLEADETLTGLFSELKTVTKEDKFKVVNKIKMHIIELKNEERLEAIKVLMAKKNAIKKEAVKSVDADVIETSHIEHAEVGTDEHHAEMMSMSESMGENMDSSSMPMSMENMNSMSTMSSNMESMSNMPLMEEMRTNNANFSPSSGMNSNGQMRRK